jgi:hypothetical protein
MLNPRLQDLITATREQLAKNAQNALLNADSVKNVAPTMAFKAVPNSAKGYNTPEKKPQIAATSKENLPTPVLRLKVAKPAQLLPPDLLECWQEAAAQLEPHQQDLSKCYRLAVALRALALYQNSKVRVKTATLPLFVPVVWVAYWLGCSEKYVWDMLRGRLLGGAMLARLVGYRAWCTSWAGRDGSQQTRRGGCVFTVRCSPCDEGREVSVDGEAYKQSYRNLSADIANGYTFAQMVKGDDCDDQKRERGISSASKTPRNKATEKLKDYLHSTLPQLYNYKCVKSDTELSDDADIYTVIHALNEPMPKGHERRGEWVVKVANQICHVLNDTHSTGGWQKALWVVVKARAHGIGGAGECLTGALFEAVVRASDNALVRNRAALASSIMRKNGWGELEEAVSAFYAGREVVA